MKPMAGVEKKSVRRTCQLLGEIFADIVTLCLRDNQRRMEGISSFVGHLANVVFLHIGAGFLASLNAEATGLQFWTTLVAGVGLRLLAIVFIFRLGEVISQWLQGAIRQIIVALSDDGTPPEPPSPLFSALATVTLIIFLNVVTYSFSAAVGDFARSQIPALANPNSAKPVPSGAPHMPSCFGDQCWA